MMICSCPGIVSTSDCTNELGVSIFDTSLSYFAPITPVIKTLSVAAVGILTPSRCFHAHCILSLAKVLYFILPALLYFKNVK